MAKCDKTLYATEEIADSQIRRIKKISKRAIVPERSYFCTKCRGWHLTSDHKFYKQQMAIVAKRILELEDENKKLIGTCDRETSVDKRVKAMNEKLLDKNRIIKKLRTESVNLIMDKFALERKIAAYEEY